MSGPASATAPRPSAGARVAGLVPLGLIALVAIVFALLGAPGLGDRNGPPVEDLAVERTTLRSGEIELKLRNDGADSVSIAQVVINDSFLPFDGAGDVGRLESRTLTINYPWIEGEAYELSILTSTGVTIDHTIETAVETPEADAGFFGLMALLGIYVGVIPVSLGMLWLPFVRRIDERWIRGLLAFTIGLLAFLAIDAALEGLEIAAEGPQLFGGSALVYLGALVAYLSLSGVETYMRDRRGGAREAGAGGMQLALLVAVGIGLHNLGEGLAIGSAYAAGALALGAFLVVGFALHNTTEGLAIVAPLANEQPRLRWLVALGLIAGAPAIIGAWIGAAAFNSSLVAFLLGVGAGAIVQIIQQLLAPVRDEQGRALYPLAVGAMLAGIAVLWLTGLLINV